MTDRELLELAAKAAGMEWCHWYEESKLAIVDHRVWNPFTDDGDALSLEVNLAVKLNLRVTLQFDQVKLKPPGDLHMNLRNSVIPTPPPAARSS